MRTKNFLLVLCCVIITSVLLIMISPAGQQNDSLKNIVSQTHQQLKELQENLVSEAKKLEIDVKYLSLLGFTTTQSTSSVSSSSPSSPGVPLNGTKQNFSIVTYVLSGQTASVILFIQNIINRLPNENLLIYDLGLSDDDLHLLNSYCNNTKCSVITYDLTPFPSHVTDERMHAYRPLIIKDALMRSKSILFIENTIRLQISTKDLYDNLFKNIHMNNNNRLYNVLTTSTIGGGGVGGGIGIGIGTSSSTAGGGGGGAAISNYYGINNNYIDANDIDRNVIIVDTGGGGVGSSGGSGKNSEENNRNVIDKGSIFGWKTLHAVSSRTHPKMFEYFQTHTDSFLFLPMISMDVVLFVDSQKISDNILLPWIKCVLTFECIHPIGAQSAGCRYNKKPLYRYSGCHAYDASAFNIVLGLMWNFDEEKYSMPINNQNLFYKESLEQSIRILENKRRNITNDFSIEQQQQQQQQQQQIHSTFTDD